MKLPTATATAASIEGSPPPESDENMTFFAMSLID